MVKENLLYVCVHAYTCSCGCVHMRMHVCKCVRKPEVDARYLLL